jgi:uncharacterized phage-like protein YoqJ
MVKYNHLKRGSDKLEKGCSFTGHRQIKSEHSKRLGALVEKAIEYAYGEGCRLFYSGGAIGFDTVAARAVVKFRITHPDVRLVMLLPCLNQDAKWSAEQKDAYSFILSAADEVEYVSEEYTDSCMRERNFLLASRADIVFAYVGHPRSGSAQTARMADSMGKTVYNLYKALETENTNIIKG